MKKTKFMALAIGVIALLSSCAKDIALESDEEQGQGGKTTLVVQTRANEASGQGEISYPVAIYVFDKGRQCVAVNTITAADQKLSLRLSAGIYKVYAIGGADNALYELPDKATASSQALITLKEGKAFNDLMASAECSVTLEAGGNNKLEIQLSRKVLELKSVVIKGLDADVEAVSLLISPLYSALLLDGSYTGENSIATVPLEKNDNGEWVNKAGIYLLPASGPAMLTVSFTQNGNKQSFSYATTESLEANHRLNIVGNYQSGELDMAGTLTGAVWEADQLIDFTFNGYPKNVPQVGTFINNHKYFVVKADTAEDHSITVSVFSCKYASNVFKKGKKYTQAEIKAAKDSVFKVMLPDNEPDWRLPTEKELFAFMAQLDNYNAYAKTHPTEVTPLEKKDFIFLYMKIGNYGTGDFNRRYNYYGVSDTTRIIGARPITYR